MKILLIILLIAAVLIIGMSYLLFHFIFYRPKRSTKIPKSYVGTPHYNVSRAGMAVMKTLPSEDLYLTSRDGLKLHAYLFPSEGEGAKKKFLIGIHGYKSYSRPEFGPYIEFYRSLGYSLVLPDDRAHGPSEGKYIGFGVLDRLDCVDWAKNLVSLYGEDIEILLHGVSMGAATVLAASGEEDLPQQVKGIISDCGFSKAWDVLSHELKEMAHFPVKPFLPICEKICEHRAGYNFHDFAPIDQVKKSRTPILVVHGSKDPMVPVRMAQQIYDSIASPKRLLIVPEAGHGESIAFAPEEYHQAIREFFNIA